MVQGDFPEGFTSRQDYLEHIAKSFDSFHRSINNDHIKFVIVRHVGMGLAGLILLLVLMRISVPDTSGAVEIIGVTSTLLFILLLLHWFVLRNMFIHNRKVKLREYAHKLEELQEEQEKYNKHDLDHGHWWETAEIVVHKSERILKKARYEQNHFMRYVTHLGYLTILALLLLIIKFIFKIA